MYLSLAGGTGAPADLPVADDLLETLETHKDGCVGMAANMIGVKKRIISVGKPRYQCQSTGDCVNRKEMTPMWYNFDF